MKEIFRFLILSKDGLSPCRRKTCTYVLAVSVCIRENNFFHNYREIMYSARYMDALSHHSCSKRDFMKMDLTKQVRTVETKGLL